MSWEFMEMLVLGKIMDAGLAEEEHKLQGDGYVNFVEWCMPHDAKHPKKVEIAAARDKIVGKLVSGDNLVIVNLSPLEMVGHIVDKKGKITKKQKEDNKAGAEGEGAKTDDNGKAEKSEFHLKKYDMITFVRKAGLDSDKQQPKYEFVYRLMGANNAERKFICERNAGAPSIGIFI